MTLTYRQLLDIILVS